MKKNIFITGGTSDIGKQLVTKFAEKKWNIFFTYNSNFKEAKDISKKLKKNNIDHYYTKMDLKSSSSIIKAFKLFYSKFKNLNYLINNATITHKRKLFTNIKNPEIKDDINGFLVGNIFVIKNAIKLITKKNKIKDKGIINISSYASITGGKNIHLYAASKAAINILLHALSLDYKKDHLRICSVLPRYIDTKTFRKNNKIRNNKDLSKFLSKQNVSKIKKPGEFAHFIYKIIQNKNKHNNRSLIYYDKI